MGIEDGRVHGIERAVRLRRVVPDERTPAIPERRHPVADGLDSLGRGRGDRRPERLERFPLVSWKALEGGVDLCRRGRDAVG